MLGETEARVLEEAFELFSGPPARAPGRADRAGPMSPTTTSTRTARPTHPAIPTGRVQGGQRWCSESQSATSHGGSHDRAGLARGAGLPEGSDAGQSTPWRELDFSVIDLETTGLNPARDEIVSFATVTVSGGKVRLDDAVYELVRPRRMPGERIHPHPRAARGDLVDAPPLEDVLGGSARRPDRQDPGRPRRCGRGGVPGERARRAGMRTAKPVRRHGEARRGAAAGSAGRALSASARRSLSNQLAKSPRAPRPSPPSPPTAMR